DRFDGSEFVYVVVARLVFLIGQRPVELVALVALCGIQRGRGIGIRRPGQATANARCREDRPRRQTLQEAAAIAEDRLARRGALGQFPAASSSDQHRIRPVDSRSMWALRGRPPSHAFVKAPLGLRPSPGFGLRPQPPSPAMRERGFSRFYCAASWRWLAMTFSASRPVSSCIWSNLCAKLPTPRVSERNSTIKSCNSLRGR